jgi:hypothetical protein
VAGAETLTARVLRTATAPATSAGPDGRDRHHGGPVPLGAQRRAGRRLDSASAVADSKQTLLCSYLSAVLLAGLAANSVLGWWWADPAAGLVIAAVAVREGWQAWRGDTCCPPIGTADPGRSAEDGTVALSRSR